MKSLFTCSPKSLLVSFFCAGALANSAHAAVLVNDNFTLSSGINVGTVSNTESAGVGTYSTVQPSGSAGMTVTTASGFGSGNVLSLANNTFTYYRGFDGGSTLTLNSLAANQTLSMKYDVRFDGSFVGADNYSFGFVNTTSANSIAYANIDLNGNGTIDSEYRYRTGSFNMSDAGTIIGSVFPSTAFVSGTGYAIEFDITKTGSGDFKFDYYLNNTLQSSQTFLSTSTWATSEAASSITGIAFRHSQVPNVTTYIDNVLVSTVPEPSTVGFVGLGMGLVLLRLRRRWTIC